MNGPPEPRARACSGRSRPRSAATARSRFRAPAASPFPLASAASGSHDTRGDRAAALRRSAGGRRGPTSTAPPPIPSTCSPSPACSPSRSSLFGLSLSTDRYLLILFVPALVLRRGRALPPGLWDLRGADLGLLGASRPRARAPARPVLHAAAQPGQVAVRRDTADRRLQQWFWTAAHWYDHADRRHLPSCTSSSRRCSPSRSG